MANYMYFEIFDDSHKKCMIGGDKYDGEVYHYDSNERTNAQWRFVSTGDDYYNIIDQRHSKALVAGDEYDGKVYHGDAGDRLNAQWKIIETGTPGTFMIVDRKHGKALVAGDDYDEHLYHQDPRDRANARWTLKLKREGDVGPKVFVKEERLVSVVYKTDLTKSFDQPDVVLSATGRNGTDVQQSFTIRDARIVATTQTWTFGVSVMTGLLAGLTARAEAGTPGVASASVEAKVEARLEVTTSFTKGGSKTTTRELEFSIPVNVPPGKTIRATQTYKCDKRDIPFVVKTERVLGDGTVKPFEYEGVWSGVEFQATSVALEYA